MLAAYLDRIEAEPPARADAETLRRLQEAHLLHVPFENLDISLQRPIRLETLSLLDKIVTRRRGGFCYELNSLFAWLLRELGFRVSYLSASDSHPDGSFSPEFDHLVLQVFCPDDPERGIPWLADVGWGDSSRYPLRLDSAEVQFGGLKYYRLTPEEPYLWLWEQHTTGEWERQYRFTLQTHSLAEFEPMCRYHQTSPDSYFTQRRLCTLATPAGRITLENGRLIETYAGQREEREISSQEEPTLLRDLFGIDLNR